MWFSPSEVVLHLDASKHTKIWRIRQRMVGDYIPCDNTSPFSLNAAKVEGKRKGHSKEGGREKIKHYFIVKKRGNVTFIHCPITKGNPVLM